jgi:hypothetical protein
VVLRIIMLLIFPFRDHEIFIVIHYFLIPVLFS